MTTEFIEQQQRLKQQAFSLYVRHVENSRHGNNQVRQLIQDAILHSLTTNQQIEEYLEQGTYAITQFMNELDLENQDKIFSELSIGEQCCLLKILYARP